MSDNDHSELKDYVNWEKFYKYFVICKLYQKPDAREILLHFSHRDFKEHWEVICVVVLILANYLPCEKI